MDQPTVIQLVAATNNAHKLTEIRSLLGPDFRILSLDELGYTEELAETGHTLESNAAQKANAIFDRYGLPCFADDTGLEVDVLGGAPGVYSARYAGPQRNSDDNMDRLLRELAPHTDRNARFRTVIAWKSSATEKRFEGIVQGMIGHEKRGGNGFGYDPLFIPEGDQRTLAEMSLAEKNAISHRRRALDQLVQWLKDGTPR